MAQPVGVARGGTPGGYVSLCRFDHDITLRIQGDSLIYLFNQLSFEQFLHSSE